MQVKIKPIKPNGRVSAIASKSDAHRAIICAALADKKTNIGISHVSCDIEATLNCIKNMGANLAEAEGTYTVTPMGEPAQNPTLDCGESGSTLRFLLPVAAALGMGATFVGEGRLPMRPMGPIADLLRNKGNNLSSSHLPTTVSGRMQCGVFEIAGDVSSQFISGLLFALPLLRERCVVRLTSPLESSAYVDMTVDTLGCFGIRVERVENEFIINGSDRYTSPGEYIVEGDWSNAAFFMVLGAMGGEIKVTNLRIDSRQADKRILDALSLAGVKYLITEDGITVEKSEIKPFDIDVSECPDLFPVLSILACGARGKSTLYNAHRLRIKESDRIKSARELILNLGGMAEETEDSLIIYGDGSLKGGTVESYNDHRIAMSAFVASAICEGDIILKGAEAINKSYPSFAEDFRSVGGVANVI